MWESTDKISQAASYYLQRSKIIEGNIANADTPLYQPRDLTFKQVLEEATRLKTDDPKHLQPGTKERVLNHLVEVRGLSGYDTNRVNVEAEMAKLAESSIMYKSLVETMKKEFEKLKLSISGR